MVPPSLPSRSLLRAPGSRQLGGSHGSILCPAQALPSLCFGSEAPQQLFLGVFHPVWLCGRCYPCALLQGGREQGAGDGGAWHGAGGSGSTRRDALLPAGSSGARESLHPHTKVKLFANKVFLKNIAF